MTVLRRLLRGLRLIPVLLKRAVAKAWRDRILGLSAEAAFWQMLSLPSLFLALVASLGYAARWFGPSTPDRAEREIEHTLSHAFSPQVVHNIIAPTLNEVLHGDRVDVISISFVLALWAGSSATATFVNTVTIAYDRRDLRGPVRSRLLALALFLGTVVLGVLLLPMLVLGPDLLRRSLTHLPHGVRGPLGQLIDIGYYPVLIVLLLLGLTTFYRLAPPKPLPWHRGLPGAVLALLVFLAGSAALREYIGFVLDHNHAYAALAAPIAALLFLFVLALGVLLGAEFNAVVEQARPARHRPARVLDPKNWQLFRSAELDGPTGTATHASPDESIADGADGPGPTRRTRNAPVLRLLTTRQQARPATRRHRAPGEDQPRILP